MLGTESAQLCAAALKQTAQICFRALGFSEQKDFFFKEGDCQLVEGGDPSPLLRPHLECWPQSGFPSTREAWTY